MPNPLVFEGARFLLGELRLDLVSPTYWISSNYLNQRDAECCSCTGGMYDAGGNSSTRLSVSTGNLYGLATRNESKVDNKPSYRLRVWGSERYSSLHQKQPFFQIEKTNSRVAPPLGKKSHLFAISTVRFTPPWRIAPIVLANRCAPCSKFVCARPLCLHSRFSSMHRG
jgi:hypothetical protein